MNLFRTVSTLNKYSLRTLHLCVILLLLSITLAGCNLPRLTPTPATDAISVYTQAAETVSAQLTALATSTPAAASSGTSQAPGAPTQEQPTLTTAASSTITPSPTADLTQTPTPAIPVELVFEDDFSEDHSWYTEENSRFSLKLSSDGYVISVNIRNAPIWSTRDQIFDDVIVDVDTTRLSGAKSGYSGLVCRHQDGDNYYALVIFSEGTYGIAKMKDGEFKFIQEGSDQSSVIKSGSANQVRAECIGENLSLYANGQLLLRVQDNDFTAGAVGLLAGTRADVPFEAFFDNFAIYLPFE